MTRGISKPSSVICYTNANLGCCFLSSISDFQAFWILLKIDIVKVTFTFGVISPGVWDFYKYCDLCCLYNVNDCKTKSAKNKVTKQKQNCLAVKNWDFDNIMHCFFLCFLKNYILLFWLNRQKILVTHDFILSHDQIKS